MISSLYPVALGIGVATKAVQQLIENTFSSSFVPEAYKSDDSLTLKIRQAYENSLPWITRSTFYDMVWRSLPTGFFVTYIACKKMTAMAAIPPGNRTLPTLFIGAVVTMIIPKVRELLYAMTEKMYKMLPSAEGYIRPLADCVIGPSRVVYEEGDLKGKEALLWYPAGQEPTKADETYRVLSFAAFLAVIALLPFNRKCSRVINKINLKIQSWERRPKPWLTVAAFGLFRIACCYQRICEEIKQCQEDLTKKDLSFKGQIWRGMRLLWNGLCIVVDLNAIRNDTMTIGKAAIDANSNAQK